MFSSDHQRKNQQEPEGRRFGVARCTLMLSGQPRFSKSHALITCPSVKKKKMHPRRASCLSSDDIHSADQAEGGESQVPRHL